MEAMWRSQAQKDERKTHALHRREKQDSRWSETTDPLEHLEAKTAWGQL